jgi:hypothetical protein
MESGVSRTVVFASKGGLPDELISKYADLGVNAYQLVGLLAADSHAETAALAYRASRSGEGLVGLPADQRLASVKDAYSTNQVCGGACAADLTGFIGRPGVETPEGSNGWLAGRVVNSGTLDDWRSITGGGRAIEIAAEMYQEFADEAAALGPEEQG